jgi:glycine/D-amino acid oxidase-like deaminating enzyme
MDAVTETLETYYAANALAHGARPRLSQDIDTGTCIIGGGLAGLWIARALARRGQDVVVLESGRIAGQASGRNGGFVSAGFAQELDAIIDRVGLSHARALYRLSREGVEAVRAFAAEGKRQIDPQPGRLSVLRYDDEQGLRREAERLARDFDHSQELWPTERVRATLATECYYQGLHDAEAFHIHPYNLALALAADIEAAGGRIFELSPAIDADLDGVRKWVGSAHARVRAHHVVFCGSAFLGRAFPELAGTVLPAATHIAVTAPLGERLHHAIGYGGGISDTRRAFDYYRILGGDRLMWGGYLSTRLSRPHGLAQRIGQDILKIYPQLDGLHIEYAWSGIMGYAIHRMPQIGSLRKGVWIASAFGGQGLNTTAMAGELISSAILENDDRWRLFVPFGLVWAGGLIGRAATQATYWSMALGDAIDETWARLKPRVDRWKAEWNASAAIRKVKREERAAERAVLREIRAKEREERRAQRAAERVVLEEERRLAKEEKRKRAAEEAEWRALEQAEQRVKLEAARRARAERLAEQEAERIFRAEEEAERVAAAAAAADEKKKRKGKKNPVRS